MQKVRAFERHFKKYPLLYKLKEIRSKLWFSLPLERLFADTEFMQQWQNFKYDLDESTNETLLCAGLAAHQCILKELPPLSMSQQSGVETTSKFSLLTIRVRIQDHTPIVDLHSLKQNNYGRLITVRGTVIRVSEPEIVCSWLAFRCATCHCEQAIRQTNRLEITLPASCKGSGCRARSNFQSLLSSPFTRTEPYQTIRLQESMQNAKNDSAGQIPRSIEVELAHDLVDCVCPGDDVTLTGVINVKDDRSYQRSSRCTEASIHKFYINGITVVNNKNTMSVRTSDFTEKELELIEQVKNDPDVFNLFVHSLCPPIFGHEMVKAGLILALFGGSGDGNTKNEQANSKRSETHVLVVGDPGLGKSHLLQSCVNVAPRGIFVCGNSTSNAGLTVSLRHEKGVGGSLEAGALVLADQGVCCIDEFDKMSSNYQVSSSNSFQFT